MVKKEDDLSADSGRIPWHPAFVQAMRLELDPTKAFSNS
jgi:hypothetical protein